MLQAERQYHRCDLPQTVRQGRRQPHPPDHQLYAGEGVPWVDKTRDERKAYMTSVVLPTMKAKFIELDPVLYQDMSCSTCHQDPMNDNFDMPNPDLPQFDFADFPSPDSEDPDIARYATFMTDHVAPTMTDLLGYEPFDFETGEGFGCMNCHTPVTE
jgi:hypothetical protein